MSKKILPFIFLAGTLFLLLAFPELALTYAKNGLLIWYQKMVPALLPMMILTSCMIKTNLTESFSQLLHPVTKKLYHLSPNGTYALFVGFLCGFPIGAKTICELYTGKKLSKKEADLLLPICNNIGPVFMLSYGLKTFLNKNIYFVLMTFYAIPLLYALFLFNKKSFQKSLVEPKHKSPFCVALDESISESASGILSLGGYLMFFNILSIVPLKLFEQSPKWTYFSTCILEITNGLSHKALLPPYFILSLIQFGGICCIFQTIKYISKTDLSIKRYIMHKTVMSILTFGVFLVLEAFFSVF